MKILILIVFLLSVLPVFGQKDIETLIRKSEELTRQDKFPEAIAVMTEAIGMQPENAALYIRRSEIYRGKNKTEAFFSDLRKAAALAPDDKQIIAHAAVLFNSYGEFNDSLNILSNYISKDSTTADIFYLRSNAKSGLDDLIGAYDDLTTASELDPENIAYRAAQAEMLPKLGDSEKAFGRFAQLIKGLEAKLAKTDPKYSIDKIKDDLSWVYQMRARVFHSKGDTQAEFADLAKYVEYCPKFYTYEQRARLYIDHEMYQEAIADFTEAIRLADHPPTGLLVQRGETYIMMEKFAEAARDYEAALKIEGTVNTDSLKQRLSWINRKM